MILPFILYNLSAEDRAIMAQHMPPSVTQELVPVVWKDHWAPMKPFLLGWPHQRQNTIGSGHLVT